LSTLIDQADQGCRIAKERGSTSAVQWTESLAQDIAVSERRRCTECQATTSLLVRKTHRQVSALQACANCGALL
jgi:hypothetical protein